MHKQPPLPIRNAVKPSFAYDSSSFSMSGRVVPSENSPEWRTDFRCSPPTRDYPNIPVTRVDIRLFLRFEKYHNSFDFAPVTSKRAKTKLLSLFFL